jgi:colicin import membrane protein
MPSRKNMKTPDDSATRRAKLAELDRERQQLLEEERQAEEAEAREREAAIRREREAAAVREREAEAARERARRQQRARAEVERSPRRSASPRVSQSGGSASTSRYVSFNQLGNARAREILIEYHM